MITLHCILWFAFSFCCLWQNRPAFLGHDPPVENRWCKRWCLMLSNGPLLHSSICECSLSLRCIRCLFISYNREPHCGLTIPIIIQITEPKEAKRPNEEWISSHLESERTKRPRCSMLEVTLVVTWVPTLQDIEIMITNRGLNSFFFELATADYFLKCLNIGFEVVDSMASSYLQSSYLWENIGNA